MATVLRDTLKSLAFLHHKVVHRDVKAGNILLDRQGNVVLRDSQMVAAVTNSGLSAVLVSWSHHDAWVLGLARVGHR